MLKFPLLLRDIWWFLSRDSSCLAVPTASLSLCRRFYCSRNLLVRSTQLSRRLSKRNRRTVAWRERERERERKETQSERYEINCEAIKAESRRCLAHKTSEAGSRSERRLLRRLHRAAADRIHLNFKQNFPDLSLKRCHRFRYVQLQGSRRDTVSICYRRDRQERSFVCVF